ncbi:MAG: EscR/YscR/HrcR family type III secretion system export apparatus protein [Bdellovibrionales bacterium]|nr:EscR/YscR/HrcR family type III secretion system export apparatus protein [Bdellovibrionales bacterium]
MTPVEALGIAETNPIWLIVLSGVLAFLPIVVGMGTSYVKVSIVLGMVRNAIGAQQVPGPMVSMALAAGLSLYIMQPVLIESAANLEDISLSDLTNLPQKDTVDRFIGVLDPWRRFLEAHVGEREKIAFEQLRQNTPRDDSKSLTAKQEGSQRISWSVLLPAFVVTELKEAFAMGFAILLPFVVIDLIVANILVGMGMYMVSPFMISLPIKLLLFVVSDAWLLLSKGLIGSYSVVQ